ncbi:hypothetical protein TNCV_455921 [Trichonephila clavipes]|nr:hypothetical protein TNCV_455921 [Trichonephila clavipes]
MLQYFILGVLQVSAVPGICQMTGTLPPLSDSAVGGGMKLFFALMDPMLLYPGKGLVLPTLNKVSTTARFLVLSLEKNEMSKKSLFVIQKALIGTGGEPKSVK